MGARRIACISGLSLVLALVFVVLTASASSRDEAPAVRPAGPEATLASVTPVPGVTLTARPPAGECVTLSIPKIHVSAHVLAMGTDSGGQQELPDNPVEVSWWKDVIPGQPGNAVFAGHTWAQGDGVFDRLSELAAGDVVKVHGNGCETTFQVTTVDTRVPVNLPSDQVEALYATDGAPGLVLITCGDYSGGEYHSRIVVHARLVQ